MRWKTLFFWFLFVFVSPTLFAQISADCVNAIPICNNTPVNSGTMGYGIDDFNGASASGCLEPTITGAIESNSAWYRFRTGASGQLGFNIGFDSSEDWDFALYQTNDCNNLGDPVRCNFFDNRDMETFMGVGEDPNGNADTFLYEDWLDVSPGEDYYLLINNFSNTNSGFSIQFSGEIFVTNPYDALDCSIISNLLGPPLAACEGDPIVLDATTTDVLSYTWYSDTGSGFQLLPGETNPALNVTTSALYRVEVIRTTQNNLISDVQVFFSPAPTAQAMTDAVSCSGLETYNLEVKNAEVLGSQDPSDFVVTYHEDATDAQLGINPLPALYSPSAGSVTIFARISSQENPACFDASQSFDLTVVQTPELDIETDVYICESTTGVEIGEISGIGQYDYMWSTGENTSSIFVSQDGEYTLTVTNSGNGVDCSITKTVSVTISLAPRIDEVIVEDLQKNNTIQVLTELDVPYEYQLDNGPIQASNIFSNVAPGLHTVTINDPKGCGSVSAEITVVGFPKFFTPNGDGANDFWHIEGLESLQEPIVHIFNRYGMFIKELDMQSVGWDGTFNGRELPSTDYWFKLSYMDVQGQRVEAAYINNHFALRR
ncbi:MAG: T9SS type B sorting domain-containing protein [Bacteroidia bacterium]|nr:T9SS type B sorting domain-containing protein [Bacteroidia bacterium]